MKRCLVLFLIFLPAWVQAGGDLDRASQMLYRMSYKKALTLARKVLRSADAGPEDLASAYHIEGLSLSALGHDRKALRSFRKLLAIDPEFEVSRDVSPKLTRPFRKAKAGKNRPKPIRLVHIPPGPVETLDGLRMEATLETDDLHMVRSVRLRYRDGEGAEQTIEVPVGRSGPVSASLPESLGARKVEYYFEAANQHGGVLTRAGSRSEPFRLAAEPKKIVLAPVTAAPTPPLADPAVEDPYGEGQTEAVVPWYKSWWFWTAVGVVVTGAAAGTILAVSGDGSGDVTSYQIRFR